jgi:hypothetical protein
VTGVGPVPADATAVVLNVTSTQATSAEGFVTVWPDGVARPTASNLNLRPGQNLANLVMVRAGPTGNVRLYTNRGSVHLIVDVVGYYAPGTGFRFRAVTPSRVLSTPPGPPLSGPGELAITVPGTAGVPPEATALVLNVTSAQATSANGFVTVWPDGVARPTASNLNLNPGQNLPNLAVTRVGGTGGVRFYTNTGSVHLFADVFGYFGPDATACFTGVTPARVLDTRTGPVPPGRVVGDPLSGPGELRLDVTGVAGVPPDAAAVVLNVTSAQATSANGFVTVWPDGVARPTASNLNLNPGQNLPNLVVVGVGATGDIRLYTNTGSVHLIADVVGYFR